TKQSQKKAIQQAENKENFLDNGFRYLKRGVRHPLNTTTLMLGLATATGYAGGRYHERSSSNALVPQNLTLTDCYAHNNYLNRQFELDLHEIQGKNERLVETINNFYQANQDKDNQLNK